MVPVPRIFLFYPHMPIVCYKYIIFQYFCVGFHLLFKVSKGFAAAAGCTALAITNWMDWTCLGMTPGILYDHLVGKGFQLPTPLTFIASNPSSY